MKKFICQVCDKPMVYNESCFQVHAECAEKINAGFDEWYKRFQEMVVSKSDITTELKP